MNYNTNNTTNPRKSDTAMKVRPERRTGRKGLGRVSLTIGMSAAALIGSAGIADASEPAPLIPAASAPERAPITWRVGEHMTGSFDARPGDTIVEHYGIHTSGGHIIARCASSGGHVVFDHIAGFNGYACRGLDF